MSGDGDRVARCVVIRGRVQGVYFRAWTEEQATKRGLAGWVQNMPDGSVKAKFIGPEAAVAIMIEACRFGPRDARVDTIEVSGVEPLPPIEGFRINR